jgi:hypothetical protein
MVVPKQADATVVDTQHGHTLSGRRVRDRKLLDHGWEGGYPPGLMA